MITPLIEIICTIDSSGLRKKLYFNPTNTFFKEFHLQVNHNNTLHGPYIEVLVWNIRKDGLQVEIWGEFYQHDAMLEI